MCRPNEMNLTRLVDACQQVGGKWCVKQADGSGKLGPCSGIRQREAVPEAQILAWGVGRGAWGVGRGAWGVGRSVGAGSGPRCRDSGIGIGRFMLVNPKLQILYCGMSGIPVQAPAPRPIIRVLPLVMRQGVRGKVRPCASSGPCRSLPPEFGRLETLPSSGDLKPSRVREKTKR